MVQFLRDRKLVENFLKVGDAKLLSLCEGALSDEQNIFINQSLSRNARLLIASNLIGDIKIKSKKRARLAAKNRRAERKQFYFTDEWRAIRYQALKANDGRCELCGRGRNDGVILHVDHIKPRSKYPELELELSNTQVLCEDCNMGKSNRDETDWREPRLATLMGERI